jgi:hypothetical protein
MNHIYPYLYRLFRWIRGSRQHDDLEPPKPANLRRCRTRDWAPSPTAGWETSGALPGNAGEQPPVFLLAATSPRLLFVVRCSRLASDSRHVVRWATRLDKNAGPAPLHPDLQTAQRLSGVLLASSPRLRAFTLGSYGTSGRSGG